jgi:acyl-CoA thioesterase-1
MIRQILLVLLAVTTGYANVIIAGINTEKSQPVILVIGDSLSSGHGIDPDKDWVSLLRHRLKQNSFPYQLVNSSISGDTTGNGLKRLPSLLTEYRPSYVIIELGGNDGLRGLSLSVMKHNLSTMIALSQQSHAKVLLAGIKIPPNYGKKYTQAFYNVYQSLSSEYKTPLIPFLLDSVGANSDLMQKDGIHPTSTAQSIILNTAWPYIETLITH